MRLSVLKRVGAILLVAGLPVWMSCSPIPEESRTRIEGKMRQFHDALPQWVRNGGDPGRIEPLVHTLQEYIKAGKSQEAERELDELLSIVTASPPKHAEAPEAQGGSPEGDRTGLTEAKNVTLGKIPADAELVYHSGGQIYVMRRDGRNPTQITFGRRREYEHAAVSFDHRYILANERRPESALWLFDLERGTEAQVVPGLFNAGDGGVDWDSSGFMYFAAASTRGRLTDVYKVKVDGTGLRRLTTDDDAHDVSVSDDGTIITFVSAVQASNGEPPHTEIWTIGSDGSNPRMIYRGGTSGIASAHDPEVSPDGKQIVFSVFNSQVPPNFPSIPGATAHDLYVINIDGSGLRRVTRPGPISIIPDWSDNLLVFTELNGKDKYKGLSTVKADGRDQVPGRIQPNASSAKWIPTGRPVR
jgi:hypothetical protein